MAMEQVLVEAWFTFQLQSKYNLTRTLFCKKLLQAVCRLEYNQKCFFLPLYQPKPAFSCLMI